MLIFFFFISCMSSTGPVPTEPRPKPKSSKKERPAEKVKTPQDSRIVTYLQYTEYGLDFIEYPEFEDVMTVDMIITCNEGITLSYSLSKKPDNTFIQNSIFEETRGDGSVKIQIIFPESGNYEFMIAGKEESSKENSYYGLAALKFSAAVPEGAGVFPVMDGEDLQILRLGDVGAGEVPWLPGMGTTFNKYFIGRSAEDQFTTVHGNKILLTSGLEILFVKSGNVIRDISFRLAEDTPIKVGRNDVVFEKDSIFYKGNINIYGNVLGSTELLIADMELEVPGSSRVYFYNDSISRIDLEGRAELKLNERTFIISRYFSFNPWSTTPNVSFGVGEDIAVGTAKTSFTCPAGSYLTYINGNLARADIIEPVVFTVDGEKVEIEGKKVVYFTDDGGIGEVLDIGTSKN